MMALVIRVQAQLTEAQHAHLRRVSERRGVSVAALLREGADRVLREDAEPRDDVWERAWRAIRGAQGSGRSDVSEDHDRHLDAAFGG